MEHQLDIALSLAIQGKLDESEKILRGESMDDARVVFNLGWHDIRHDKLYDGMNKLNAGRLLNVFGSPPLKTIAPIWRGPDPIILLRSEGGLGDQILNARFAKNLSQHGTVILMTDESLVELFSSIDGVSMCISDNTPELPYHDYWVPAMSAPFVLKMEHVDLKGTPYLKATPKKLNGDFKVGFRWSGNPQFEHEQHRRFDPTLMLELANISGITPYSLQRDDNLIDVPFTDFRDNMNTWMDTASILMGLDLLITSDTAIAHCSAALGVETWIIVPILPYYPWALPGDRVPWYDSVKLFRQEKYGDWSVPFENIRNCLKLKV